MVVRVGDADIEVDEAKLRGASGGGAMQEQARLAARLTDDLDLAPGNLADAGAERFGAGFFGGETTDQALDALVGLLAFGLGEDAAHETLAMPLIHSQNPRPLDEIDAEGDGWRAWDAGGYGRGNLTQR